MLDIQECPIPRGPNDLCFSSNEFTRESFSVDHFLQDHRNKANLETMRDDLGVYLKVLRSAMIELINKDYTDFVNLSSNLIGLDKGIGNIQTPLGQLKEELMQLQQNLDDATSEVSDLLEKRREVVKKKDILKSLRIVNVSIKKLQNIFNDNDDLDSMMLERAAAEYNRIEFHLSKCNNNLSSTDKQICQKLSNLLMRKIDSKFVSCVSGSKEEVLPFILGVYLTLGRASEAEYLYRKEVVSPAMKNLISEEALASNPRGLQGLFDSVIAFTFEEMKPLLKLTAFNDGRSPKMRGFEFLANSFWPEVEERFETNLSSIYAPGNPDLFYQRYTESLEFLERLEKICGNEDTVNLLRKHPTYSSFLQRWNLPVYFQIRFQEIAGEVEVAIDEPKVNETEHNWQLNVTDVIWKCLHRCWADKVFLHQLAHRFLKLNLQILARYYVWTTQVMQKKCGSDNVRFLVALYTDIETLSIKFPELCDVVSKRFQAYVSLETMNTLRKNLEESKDHLLSQLRDVSSKIVSCISTESIAGLRQVSEVPRLFRRTNRETPVKPLSYVSAVLAPAISFHNTYNGNGHCSQWLGLIFSEITKQYYTSVCDVLTSVQKTEESLRRLKKIRDRGVSHSTVSMSSNERGGDDDKIRLQLYIDVNGFVLGIEELKIQRQQVENLIGLLNLVETTQAK